MSKLFRVVRCLLTIGSQVVLTVTTTVLPATAGQERNGGAEQQEVYAIVVGISKYRDKQAQAVPYGAADAQAVAEFLLENGGLPKSHVRVLTDAAATQQEILRAIELWLPRQTSPNALVYVFYAGVGAIHPDSGEAALVPWDGHPDRPDRLLPVQRLYGALELSGADHAVVFLDTCFAAAVGRCPRAAAKPKQQSSASPLAGLAPEGRVAVLLASNGSEPSLEYDRMKHGLFTHYLLNGLQGEADSDQNGLISLNELARYTREQVSETAWGHFFRVQTPTLLWTQALVMGGGDLDLVRADRAALARRHMAIGKTLHDKGDIEAAIAEYRTAVRLSPDDAATHLRLGLALRDKGDVEGAIVSYRMTLHFRPNDPDAHYLLGTAYSEKGQLEASIEEFRQAIRLKPGFDVAYNNLGHVLEQKGDLDGAIAQYRIAAKLQPSDARAHYNLGSALKDKGDLEGSVKELREAIRLRPDHAKAHYHLGVALATMGRRDESVRVLRKFVQLTPAVPANRDMLQDAKARIKSME